MNKTIHLKTLIDKGACPEQVKLFKRMFGDSVTLTEALVLEHYARFSNQWAAANLLSPASYAEYKKIRGPALAEYDKIRDEAYVEYKKIKGTALAECKNIGYKAYAKYKKIEGPAYAEYEKSCALAFFNLYDGDNIP